MKRLIHAMGFLLFLSMGCTEVLLLLQGRWREAVPLHLCSISALCALAAAWGAKKPGIIDFLWYLGLPGALLALLFPAPAQSACQQLFNGSYVITHSLIVLILLSVMRSGQLPRPGRTDRMMLALQGIGLAAFFVNEVLNTNFLFLGGPPAGTPLEAVFAWGYPLYLLTLEAMMLALCTFQSVLLRKMVKPDRD